MERCRREIAAIEAELLAGNPDVEGLCLALSDWSAELRILQREVFQCGSGGRSVLRVHQRIEKLERALGLSDRIPRRGFKLVYVDAGGRVTGTLLMYPDGRREWIDGE